MGSLILGSLGSSLLGPIGGMIGGQAGSMLDNMLLNHKHIRKPSLQDLIVEAATMGLPIPIVYGRNKLAGNLIQADLLHAHKHSGKGGLGGSKGTPYYTYEDSFAVAICRGPIRNIWRIFADSKVIWDMDPNFLGPNTSGGIHPLVMSGYSANSDGSGGTAILYHYGTGKHSNDQVAGSSVRFYFGVEGAQSADPVMTGVAQKQGMSAAEQPAYQGLAYAVFNGLPLADFGNRIPNLSFEVNGFYSGPTNTRTTPPPVLQDAGSFEGTVFYDIAQSVIYALDNQFIGIYDANTMSLLFESDLTKDPIVKASVNPAVWPVDFLSTASNPFNNAMAGPDGTFWTVYSTNSVNGTPGIMVNFNPQIGVLGSYPTSGNPAGDATVKNLSYPASQNSNLPPPALPVTPQPIGPGPSILCGSQNVLLIMDTVGVNWQAYSMNLIPPRLISFGAYPGSHGHIQSMAWSESRQVMVGITDLNNAFVFHIPSGDVEEVTGPIGLPFVNSGFKYDVVYDPVADLFLFATENDLYSVSDITTFAPVAHLDVGAKYGGVFFSPDCMWTQQQPRGSIAIIVNGLPTAQATPILVNGGVIGYTPGPGVGATSGDGQSGGGTGGGMVYILNTSSFQEVAGVYTDGWAWGPAVDGVGPAVLFCPWGNGSIDYHHVGGGFAGWSQYKPDGYPITLAIIVSDILQECGLSLTQINTSALSSTIVFGYVISQESSGRAALEPLQEMYQFDLVEIDGVLTATFRSQSVANVLINIDENDLGARAATPEIGANPQPKVIETRKQDIELPQFVFLRYRTAQHDFYVKDFSFAIATQYAKRAISPLSTVYGVAHQSLSSTIVLSDQNAANIVIQILILQYLNRNEVQFSLPIKYIAITPGDVVNLTWHDTEGNIVSYPVYVRQADLGADNTIKIEGVSTNGSVYKASQNPGSTFVGPIPMPFGQPSTVDILETPPLQDKDDSFGFYWGACGQGASSLWGCTLVTSVDGGQSFSTIENDIFPAALGVTKSVLGAVPSPDTKVTPAPGVWDPVNSVTFVLIGGGPLAGVSPLQVLNRQNIFLIGDEIVGASNAVQNADGTYTLSLLQRGLLGSAAAMTTHRVSEKVALLASDGTILDNEMASTALNLPYLYAGITNGSDIVNSRVFQYAATGARIKPEAGCNLALLSDLSDNVTLFWNPRLRIGYEWSDGGERVTDEVVEGYQVDISNPGGVVVNTLSTWTPVIGTVGNQVGIDTGQREISYSATQQLADGLLGGDAQFTPNAHFTLSAGNLKPVNVFAGPAAIWSNRGDNAGKVYLEGMFNSLGGGNTGVGLALLSFPPTGSTIGGGDGGISIGGHALGNIWLNGVPLAGSFTGYVNAQWWGMAVDLTAHIFWTRATPTSLWNGVIGANPATGVGGVSYAATPLAAGLPYLVFVSQSTGETCLFNLGGSAFAGAVPHGFSLGWPGLLPPAFTATIYETSSRIGRGFPAFITR